MTKRKITQELYDACNRKSKRLLEKIADNGSLKAMEVWRLLDDPAIKANEDVVKYLDGVLMAGLFGKRETQR